MKKLNLLLMIFCILALVGCSNPTTGTTSTTGTTPTTGTQITEEQAKEAALSHAKLSSADVTFVKIHLDTDDGVKTYDIEFLSGTSEYDYEINAQTGEVISWDNDRV